jgi:hypothetical protein
MRRVMNGALAGLGAALVLVAAAIVLGAQTRVDPATTFMRPRPVQAVTVDAATTFALQSDYITLACTGAETINTITGGFTGLRVYVEHTDTDCTIADDDAATAANAVDLTGTATNDVGAAAKVIVLLYNGTHWYQVGESDN